ncbi:MAG TPA: spermidine/putrescine ABC transporter substrate-binding protein [Actinomycetales bacterium]|nr:spermidine/putrescine ABC transporter substrate-binding protein [Actinomycetales bacterium]
MTRRPRPPLSPEAAALVRAQVSRRAALAGAGALGIGALLAACGTSGTPTSSGASSSGDAGPKPAADRSDADKRVDWANWTLYLDYDDKTKKYPTLEAFQKQTGIRATYSEDIEDNDSYYGKISGQLKNGQDIGKDIIVLTDWMVARLLRQKYAQKLDAAQIPNKKNIAAAYASPDYDPNRDYSMTWQGGFAGLAWNKEKVPGGLRAVSDLWKPELKGRVEVLSEMRDTIGLIMGEQGVDISGNFTSDQFMTAVDELDKHISSGQIRQVKGNSYKEDLISGDALAVIGWSGDITQINFENEDKWDFALPESGGTLWADNMLVPIGAPHKKNAERLMSYYYDPKVAAEVAAYVNYICPVEGARAEMEKIDPDLADNPYIFPDAAFLKNAKPFRTLTPQEETEFSTAFQKVLGN